MMPSTNRQNALATKIERITNSASRNTASLQASVPPVAGCAERSVSSARLAACPSGLSGASSTTCCHAFVAPSRSCLPNALTMPTFNSVFVCLGSMLSECDELRERLVRLVRVVVAHAQIGAEVHVVRRELQRLLVPRDRIVVPLGVEIEIRELGARLGVRGLAVRRPTSTPSPSLRRGWRRGGWRRSGRARRRLRRAPAPRREARLAGCR